MQSFSIPHYLNRILISNHLPGHGDVLQSTISDAVPKQLLPPFDGAGFVHVLVLDFCPVPHVLVHVEYSPHALHIPFTENSILTIPQTIIFE